MSDLISDDEAKRALRKWGNTTKIFGSPSSGLWLQALPVKETNKGKHPFLALPGTEKNPTNPDAMYVLFGKDCQFVDIIAIEVSGKSQNLNDKRSRYAASTHSMYLVCTDAWLNSPSEKIKTWAQHAGLEKSILSGLRTEIEIPVRHLRVLYFLPIEEYSKWVKELVGAAHEFFAPMSSISNITSKTFRDFLKKLSPESQFYSLNLKQLGKKTSRTRDGLSSAEREDGLCDAKDSSGESK